MGKQLIYIYIHISMHFFKGNTIRKSGENSYAWWFEREHLKIIQGRTILNDGFKGMFDYWRVNDAEMGIEFETMSKIR